MQPAPICVLNTHCGLRLRLLLAGTLRLLNASYCVIICALMPRSCVLFAFFCISNSKLQLAALFHLNIAILVIVIITVSVVLGVRTERMICSSQMVVFKIGRTQLGSSTSSPPSTRCSIKAQRVEENVHAAVVPVSLRRYLDWQDMHGLRLQCCRSLRREQVARQVAENLDENWQF